MAPRHHSPLELPDLQVKASLMEAEAEDVSDGNGNKGGGSSSNGDNDRGGGRQQQGQAATNNMQTAVDGGSSGRQRTKTMTVAAILVAMAEEAVG